MQTYRRDYVWPDLMAGITVGVLAVPQCMAYAQLAGLPAVFGLYACLVPLIVYALMGTSPHLSIGPTAICSLLVIGGLGTIDGVELGSDRYIQLAISTALLTGIIQLILGAFRLGVVVSFLSRPVLLGFTTAAGILIIISQLKYIFGVSVTESSGNLGMLLGLMPALPEMNFWSVGIGSLAVVLLYIAKRRLGKFPMALVVIILSIVLVGWLDRGDRVEVVGFVPQGLPVFDIPFTFWQDIKLVFPAAMTIALMSFVETLAIGKSISAKHDFYEIRPNQELLAIGFSKALGAFFMAMPTSASFSRSAVNDNAGSRTSISALITVLILALCLLFLAPLLYHLPKAALAAIIIVSVVNLIEFRSSLLLWRIARKDFYALLATFVCTLVLGVQFGVAAGVLISLGLMIFNTARPHVATLGNLPGTTTFRNVNRFSEACTTPNVSIIRFDAQLFFGNAEYFRDTILESIKTAKVPVQTVILDASSMTDLDATGAHEFKALLNRLQRMQINFYLAGAIGPLRDKIRLFQLNKLIPPRCQYLNVAQALYACQHEHDESCWSEYALQSNEQFTADDQATRMRKQ